MGSQRTSGLIQSLYRWGNWGLWMKEPCPMSHYQQPVSPASQDTGDIVPNDSKRMWGLPTLNSNADCWHYVLQSFTFSTGLFGVFNTCCLSVFWSNAWLWKLQKPHTRCSCLWKGTIDVDLILLIFKITGQGQRGPPSYGTHICSYLPCLKTSLSCEEGAALLGRSTYFFILCALDTQINPGLCPRHSIPDLCALLFLPLQCVYLLIQTG